MITVPSAEWLHFDEQTMDTVRDIATERNRGKENLRTTRVYGGPGRTSYDNDVRGALAEWAWQSLSGLSMDTRRLMAGDGGVDFVASNGTIDVKSAPYDHGHLIFNTLDEFKTDYVVVIISQPDESRARFDCWITKPAFVELSEVRDFGYGSRYAAELEKIRRINQLVEEVLNARL